jgi:hypothetical protein
MKKGILISVFASLFCLLMEAQDYSPFSLGHEWVFDIYEADTIAGTDTMRCEQVIVSGDTVFYFVYDYVNYDDDRPDGDPVVNIFYDGVGDKNNVYVRTIIDLLYFKHTYTDGGTYYSFLYSVTPHYMEEYQLPSGETYPDCFWLEFSNGDSSGYVVAPDIGAIAAMENGVMIRALKLTNVPPVTHQTLNFCEGDSALLHDRYVSEEGEYRDTLGGSAGDSIVVTTVSLFPATGSSLEVDICEGESFMAGGAEQTTSGVYYDTLVNMFGCDSIITTTLTVNQPTGSTHNVTICEGESYMVGGALQTETGVYYDTLVNAAGCDSVVTTNLTVEECPTSLPGKGSGRSIRLYPNPTQGVIFIDAESLASFEVFNLMGKRIFRSEERSFDFSSFPEGAYYLKCFDKEGNVTVLKVIYQR